MTDEIERARRILADPCGLMLPGALGKVLLARVDELEAQLSAAITVMHTAEDKAEEEKRLADEVVRQRDAADAILSSLGYERCVGVARWKPPLGPKPDFSLVDELRARIADLEASIAAAAEERIAEASRPALDRALDKLGYALDKARNGE